MFFIKYNVHEKTKSTIAGKKMTAIFYNEEQIPIKTVHLGVEVYYDHTVPPHDADKKGQIY